MEDAFAAVGDGVRNVVRTPRLVAATALVVVVLLPVVAVLGVVSLIATLLVVGPVLFRVGVSVLVKPPLFGGIAGMAAVAFDGDGDAAFRDVTAALGDGRATSLAGAYAVQELVLVVAGIALAVVYVGGRAAAKGVGLSYSQLQLLSGGAAVVGVVAYVTVATVLQFVDVAAVLDDASARAAVARSYRLTRARPIEVAGYTAVRVLFVAACLLPGVVLVAADDAVPLVPLEPLGWVAALLLLPFGLAAAISTHVAYYRRRSREQRR